MEEIEDWPRYSETGQRIGPQHALVTVVEFADFQCPFCAQFSESYKYVAKKYGDSIALVYRHYPMLSIHPYAIEAASAALCAGDDLFPLIHDFLYEHQDSIGKLSWEEIGTRAGVENVTHLVRCIQEQGAANQLAADSAAAADLKVSGTPTILVNQIRVAGNPGTQTLDSLVRVAMTSVHGNKR